MHVILDSNIYLRDAKMEGNQFQELFAYLRRTASRLIIPMIVFSEVAERYRAQLSDEVDKTQAAWNRMRKKTISDVGNFPSPHINSEVRALKNRLRQPATGVQAVLYSDLGGVDMQELIRRGVKRLRPASSEGEELRDVILWMVVVQYAKKNDADVAFISTDANFADSDGTGLHEQLSADAARARVRIAFYREISKFVAENALETLPVAGDWFFGLVSHEAVEDKVKREFRKLKVRAGAIQNVEPETPEFVSGKKYRVGENAFYAEVLIKGQAILTVRETRAAPSEEAERPRTIHPRGFSSFFSPQDPSLFDVYAPVASGFGTLQGLGGLGPSGNVLAQPGLLGLGVRPFKYVSTDQSYTFRYNLEVSARVENDQLINLQVDSFEAKEVLPSNE